MSETPRTDAERIEPIDLLNEIVSATFARQLETELATKERELAEALASKESWRDMALAIDGKLTAAREAIRGAVPHFEIVLGWTRTEHAVRFTDAELQLAQLRSAMLSDAINKPASEPGEESCTREKR